MNRLLAAGCKIVLATVLVGAHVVAHAQSDYPNRTVKIVVPVPPGPTADLLPRILADRLAVVWQQPVIVENRPGAALNLAAAAVARSIPDGYTLLATPAPPLVINEHLYPKLGFDPNGFVPVSVLAQASNVLVVNPNVPASTLQELVSYGKSNPGKLTYASSGIGSTTHLAMELLKTLTGAEMVHVPYKASASALTDLLGGHVDVMFDNLGNVVGPIKDGKLKILAVGHGKRLETFPNAPALTEYFPDFISTSWFVLVAPPGTPLEISVNVSSAVAKIVRQPEVAKRIQEMFLIPVAGTPEEAAEFIGEERNRWRKVIDSAKIKVDDP